MLNRLSLPCGLQGMLGCLGVAEVSVTVEVGLFAEVLRKVDSSHAPSAQRLHVDKRTHFGI